MYEVYHAFSPDFITQLFPLNDHDKDTRNKSFFTPRRIFSTYSGSESISFLGPKIWELVPDNIKDCESIYSFKKSIKTWRLEDCPCRILQTYIQNVGFVEITNS